MRDDLPPPLKVARYTFISIEEKDNTEAVRLVKEKYPHLRLKKLRVEEWDSAMYTLLAVMRDLPGSFLTGAKLRTIYVPITDDAVFMKSAIDLYSELRHSWGFRTTWTKLQEDSWGFNKRWTTLQESSPRCWLTISNGICDPPINVYFVPVPAEHIGLDILLYVITLKREKWCALPHKPFVWNGRNNYLRVIDYSSHPLPIVLPPPPTYIHIRGMLSQEPLIPLSIV